jgi:hypothetical protein
MAVLLAQGAAARIGRPVEEGQVAMPATHDRLVTVSEEPLEP